MFLDKVVEKCHLNLLQSTAKIPLAYLVSRGMTLDEIKKYNIGYTGNYIQNIDPEEHEDAPAFNKWLGTKGKFVKGRLVFPVYDELGNIKGIETRALDKRAMEVLKPKFKTSLKTLIDQLPESSVRYKKFYLEKMKQTALFFGLPHTLESIWETQTAFLTEGNFDLISLLKVVPNGVTPMTANINELQLNWLRRYVKKVILLFDMDIKGKQASEKIKLVLEPYGIAVHNINLKGRDVNDFVMQYGVSELKMTITDKMDYFF
jgi:DNA primase